MNSSKASAVVGLDPLSSCIAIGRPLWKVVLKPSQRETGKVGCSSICQAVLGILQCLSERGIGIGDRFGLWWVLKGFTSNYDAPVEFFGTGGTDSDLIKLMPIRLLDANLEQSLKLTQYGSDGVIHGFRFQAWHLPKEQIFPFRIPKGFRFG
jgi:hypothetical protein